MSLQSQITQNRLAIEKLINQAQSIEDLSTITVVDRSDFMLINRASDNNKFKVDLSKLFSTIQISDVNNLQDTLDNKADLVNGKVPSNQLPAYVDDVLDGQYINSTTFNDEQGDPYVGESGKIYVDILTNPAKPKTYRWTGSVYIEIIDVPDNVAYVNLDNNFSVDQSFSGLIKSYGGIYSLSNNVSYDPVVLVTKEGSEGVEGLRLWYDRSVGNIYYDHQNNSASTGHIFRNRTSATTLTALSLIDGKATFGGLVDFMIPDDVGYTGRRLRVSDDGSGNVVLNSTNSTGGSGDLLFQIGNVTRGYIRGTDGNWFFNNNIQLLNSSSLIADSFVGKTLFLQKTGDLSTGFELGRDSLSLDAYIIQRENADLFFRTNNTERYRIDNTGYNTWTGGGSFGSNLTVLGDLIIGEQSSQRINFDTSTNWNYFIQADANDIHLDDAEGVKFWEAKYNSGGATKSIEFSTLANFGSDVNVTGSLTIETSSVSQTANTWVDDLIIKNTSDGGISILSANTAQGAIAFGDTEDANVGQITYRHSDNTMLFGINAATQLTITDSLATFEGNVRTNGGNLNVFTNTTNTLATAITVGLNLGYDSFTEKSWIQATRNNSLELRELQIQPLGGNTSFGSDVRIGSPSLIKKLSVDSGVTTDIVSFENDNGYIVLGFAGTEASLDLPTLNSFRIRQGSSIPLSISTLGNATFLNKSFHQGGINMPDNAYIQIGNSSDLQLYHDGSNSYIHDNGTGVLLFRSGSTNISFLEGDGLRFYDDMKVKFGGGTDMSIYHSSGNNYIDVDSGDLYIRTRNSGNDVIFATETTGGVLHNTVGIYGGSNTFFRAYHNNSNRLETTAAGIKVVASTSGNGQIHLASNSGNTGADNWYLRALHSDKDFVILSDTLEVFRLTDSSGNLFILGDTTSSSFIKSGGVSSEFLKADGSVDSNVYLISSDLNNYAKHNAVQSYTKQQYFSMNIVTSVSNSIAWNLDDKQVVNIDLSENSTLANPTNMKSGGIYMIAVKQNGGNRTLSFGTLYEFGDDGAPTLSTADNKTDILSFASDGVRMHFTGIRKGLDNWTIVGS